ncbi:MAG TPA: nitronate monooxygenase, partial [Umezawaea sp.]|nr:nitronate monooxygenase [Umezawaea sp.]
MSTGFLDELGVRLPVLAAPMAGGPTTPELVVAAARAGSIGFLAGGYKTPALLAEQIAAVRTTTGTFGVNLFAPNPVPVDATAYRRFRDAVRGDAERFGVAVPAEPVEDDDHWRDKVDVLLEHPVPVVSFTFGLPDARAVSALHRAGSLLVQTVTSADEALRAVDAGVDALVVQGSAAGGHSGTLTPDRIPPATPLRDLLAEVNHAAGLPKIAAGGIVDPAEVTAMITCCATAVLVGTALLLAPEAGTSTAHRGALLGEDRGGTIVTRAFTGRPARALPNGFTAAHHGHAPAGYPALHHLTSPIRRAAAAEGDPEHVNLWA